jgi:glycosyltransferase involved in cell wall biosynthesis
MTRQFLRKTDCRPMGDEYAQSAILQGLSIDARDRFVTSDPLRVLVFTSLFPSPGWPTQWVYHVNAVKALSEFCDVRVVAPIAWQRRLRYLPALLGKSAYAMDGGIPVYHPTVFGVPGIHRLHGTTTYLSVRSFIRRLRREWEFDAILGIWAYPDTYVAGHLARDSACPLVANVIGSDINELPNKPHMRPRVKAALDAAYRVIALSRAMQQRVVELGVASEKVLVQYNGVDGERFRLDSKGDSRRQLGYMGASPLICYVGNLQPEKGPDILINGFRVLTEKMRARRAELVVLGDGPLMRPLESLVHEYSLADRVRLLGRRPNAEVAVWVSAADVLCLPSLREGCPNVVLEALASGRPVVASNVGGVPELLDQDNGLLVPPGQPQLLGEALAAAVSRDWCPEYLRSTVPCLSWRDFGAGFHSVLHSAVLHASAQQSRA